jgi:hypothetical protein
MLMGVTSQANGTHANVRRILEARSFSEWLIKNAHCTFGYLKIKFLFISHSGIGDVKLIGVSICK